MKAFIVRRLLATVVVLWVVSVLTFIALSVLPGDVASAILGPEADPNAVEALRERLGLNDSLLKQYADWITGVFQGDLGFSQRTGDEVRDLIGGRIEVTVELGILSILIALIIAIPLGMIAGSRPGTVFDYGLTFFAVLGVSIPVFWLAILFVLLFAVELGWLRAIGFTSFTDDPIANLKSMAMPSAAIGLTLTGNLARQVRASMVEVLRQDYVRTAQAKGLTPRIVITRHAFRNALIPLVTVLGLQASLAVGGAIIVETIFQLPGMGKLVIDSIFFQEVPTAQALTLLIAAGVALISLLVDISYAFLDPRIRYT